MSLKEAEKSTAEPDNRKACDKTGNILQKAFIHENCAFKTVRQYLVPGLRQDLTQWVHQKQSECG